MRTRTYGGVRGRKMKVGGKLLHFPPTRFLKMSFGRDWGDKMLKSPRNWGLIVQTLRVTFVTFHLHTLQLPQSLDILERDVLG